MCITVIYCDDWFASSWYPLVVRWKHQFLQLLTVFSTVTLTCRFSCCFCTLPILLQCLRLMVCWLNDLSTFSKVPCTTDMLSMILYPGFGGTRYCINSPPSRIRWSVTSVSAYADTFLTPFYDPPETPWWLGICFRLWGGSRGHFNDSRIGVMWKTPTDLQSGPHLDHNRTDWIFVLEISIVFCEREIYAWGPINISDNLLCVVASIANARNWYCLFIDNDIDGLLLCLSMWCIENPWDFRVI